MKLKKDKQEQEPKRKIDKSKLFVRIMAGILAALMVVTACTTLIYYLFAM